MSRTRRWLIGLLWVGILPLAAACTPADDPAWAAPAATSTPSQVVQAASATPTAPLAPPTATPSPEPTATPAPTVGPPPRVIGAYPVHGDRAVGSERPLMLVFDRAMNRASVEAAFALAPASALQFSWTPDDRQVTIQPAQGWQSETPYEATLGIGATATDGAALAAPFLLSFASGGRGAPVPVLMYHHFAELSDGATQGQRDWTVSPQALQEQLEYLAAQGWHSISPTQLADYFDQGAPLPLRPLMITIDDGYREVLDVALPLFLETELRPVLFIITGYVDYSAYLNWDELATLVRAGFMIGSHSIDHSDLRQASAVEREQQIAGSRVLLQERLGVQVDAFCYPFGSLNQATKEAVAASGYRTAYSLNPTIYQSPDESFFIGRRRVDYDMTLEQFIALLPD